LATLTMGTGISAIDTATFRSNRLTTLSIPGNVTSIGVGAFQGNLLLTSVSIPIGVTSIGQGAFITCTSLASVSCFAPLSAFGSINAFQATASPLTIRVRAADATWNALVGTGKTFQGNTNVTVIKNL
jgi:hypothetical protein